MATKKTSVSVPEGFAEIGNDMVGFWKPSVPGTTLQGTISAKITTAGAEGKPNTFYSVRLTKPAAAVETQDGEKVDTDAGDLVGVGGAMLVSFMAGREGQEVFLVFKGMGPKKKGKNPAKLYGTYVRTNGDGEIPE